VSVIRSTSRLEMLRAMAGRAWMRNRRLILYCVLGGTGAFVDMVSYLVMVNWAGVHYQVANILSVLLGILTSFTLNATFTFNVTDRLLLRLLSFVIVGLVGLALSSAALYVFVTVLGFDKNLVKLGTGAVVLVQYNLNRMITFAR
jgi:putative flippase GtrA